MYYNYIQLLRFSQIITDVYMSCVWCPYLCGCTKLTTLTHNCSHIELNHFLYKSSRKTNTKPLKQKNMKLPIKSSQPQNHNTKQRKSNKSKNTQTFIRKNPRKKKHQIIKITTKKKQFWVNPRNQTQNLHNPLNI